MATVFPNAEAQHSHYGELKHNAILITLFLISGLCGLLAAVLLLQEWDQATIRHALGTSLVITGFWCVQLWFSTHRKRLITHLRSAKRYGIATVAITLSGIGAGYAHEDWLSPYGKAHVCTLLFVLAFGCLFKAADHLRRERLKRREKRRR